MNRDEQLNKLLDDDLNEWKEKHERIMAKIKSGEAKDIYEASDKCGAYIDEQRDFIIDTVDSIDAGWETAISTAIHRCWVIVERYETKEQAIAGNQKWIDSMTANPEQTLTDVPFNIFKILEKLKA